MKRFLNDPKTLVQEAIEGLILASQGRLTRLDGFPDIKVVVRADWDRSKVAVISGGGAGHEPAHAGFVGPGMLTAAVCGEVFASPSVEAVLAAILTVTGEAGCLLVVKNYTGDRLNFGLAAEQARQRGLRVETVLVADDIALPDSPQPRGVAGTLLIHKIAGAMAESGADLARISQTACRAATQIHSLGLALEVCHPPGHSEEGRLGPNEAELGLGIHGEPGTQKIALAAADQLVEQILQKLPPELPDSLLLINNLGGVPPLEMSLLTRALLHSRLKRCVKLVVGPAPLMTSYDMNGFSISLLTLDEEWTEWVPHDCGVNAWPGAQAWRTMQTLPLPDGLGGPQFLPSTEATRIKWLLAACDALEHAEGSLNELDRRVGDGDTGTTLGHAARALREATERLPLAEGPQLLQAIATLLSRVMGGSSGVLLSIFFNAAGTGLASGQTWPRAWMTGLQRMQEYGGAHLGDRTMLDALYPALTYLESEGLRSAAAAARSGADSTAAMKSARAGRSAYVPGEHLQGTNDPGAEAVALVMQALSQA
ncbi:dihydroxyacetone kinase [bacterium SCN 62-11]|nr:MAG: dihydroxyacetone kinase [bacterium SCN 62-11]